MKYIPSLLLLLCTLPLLSQENTKPIFCGNEIFSDIVRFHYPELQDAFSSTFEIAKSASHSRNHEPLNVRVVVHVVWNDPAENLDDSIIHDQIRILNEDYNRLNADTAGLRSIFQNEAGSANIHFELEQIVRVQTESLFAVDLLG